MWLVDIYFVDRHIFFSRLQPSTMTVFRFDNNFNSTKVSAHNTMEYNARGKKTRMELSRCGYVENVNGIGRMWRCRCIQQQLIWNGRQYLGGKSQQISVFHVQLARFEHFSHSVQIDRLQQRVHFVIIGIVLAVFWHVAIYKIGNKTG